MHTLDHAARTAEASEEPTTTVIIRLRRPLASERTSGSVNVDTYRTLS